MNKFYAVFFFGLVISGFNLHAQTTKCATMEIYEKQILQDPSLQLIHETDEIETQNWINSHPNTLLTRNIITIPVVVHVVFNTTQENISDAQIQSQIQSLNEDFRLLNADSLIDIHPFWPFTADSQIEFCLASKDPNGNATSGITRTQTSVTEFTSDDDQIKFTSQGGIDNWNPTKYLNIWICNLGSGLLGYATLPSSLSNFPDFDGVVIRHTSFGLLGTASAPYNQGRTATHEVGHWLNLHHIWGDDVCGDDLVSDTEPALENNFQCPTFPYNPNSTCGSGNAGEMYMNYMDYVDDACMVMFTAGQATRMRAALNGPRVGLLTSTACQSTGLDENFTENSFEIYPNPSSDKFTINANFDNKQAVSISLCNLLGEKILDLGKVKTYPFEINVTDLPNGSYFMNFSSQENSVTEKVFISK